MKPLNRLLLMRLQYLQYQLKMILLDCHQYRHHFHQ
jgi:hypothetical protein